MKEFVTASEIKLILKNEGFKITTLNTPKYYFAWCSKEEQNLNIILSKTFDIKKEKNIYQNNSVKKDLWDNYYDKLLTNKAVKLFFLYLIEHKIINL